MATRKTTEWFIKKAQLIHGDKYNYDHTEYLGSFNKVKIWCNNCHEFFYPLAHSHLQGTECKKCATQKRTKTQEKFLQEAIKIHGDKFGYELVNYTGALNKITIYCKKCKKYFEQQPILHINGCGCPYCARKHITTEDFISKAKLIHGNKYDYKDTTYKSCRTKVKIYCNKCKKYFFQAPEDHLQNKGCPFCKQSKGEKYIINWLEKNKILFFRQYKFKDCKDKRCLPFDFYLPNYNLCIEFQGEQHFIDKPHFNKNKQSNYLILRKHDQIKRNYCKDNNIKLLEISYKDNIEDKLKGCNF